MFFLLASFMMVSLSQTHMKGIPVNLPLPNTRPPTQPPPKDYVSIRITEGALIYFDNVLVSEDDVMPKLYALHQQNPDVKVSLSAEPLATHGVVMGVLDKIRIARIQKIGFQIKTASPQGAPGTLPPQPAPAPR